MTEWVDSHGTSCPRKNKNPKGKKKKPTWGFPSCWVIILAFTSIFLFSLATAFPFPTEHSSFYFFLLRFLFFSCLSVSLRFPSFFLFRSLSLSPPIAWHPTCSALPSRPETAKSDEAYHRHCQRSNGARRQAAFPSYLESEYPTWDPKRRTSRKSPTTSGTRATPVEADRANLGRIWSRRNHPQEGPWRFACCAHGRERFASEHLGDTWRGGRSHPWQARSGGASLCFSYFFFSFIVKIFFPDLFFQKDGEESIEISHPCCVRIFMWVLVCVCVSYDTKIGNGRENGRKEFFSIQRKKRERK